MLSSEFAVLWRNRSKTLEALAELQRLADESRELESDSCTNIQRLWRGQRMRELVGTMRTACIKIESIFRGCLSRSVARCEADKREEYERSSGHHYFAMLCQRSFRGYYSRRYTHDFAARKAYIRSVVEKGEQLRQRLNEQYERQLVEEQLEAQRKRCDEFKKVTRNLHHLVSTQSIPGIYNSPYDPEPPTVMGIRLETHLTSGVKNLLRLKRIRLVPNLDGVRRIDVPYEPDRRSLQASSKYDEPERVARMENKLSRVGFVGTADFRCGQRLPIAPYQRGINYGCPYHDPWRNPYLKRGIPLSTKDLDTSSSLLGRRCEQKPYYTRVGGNKSCVHPNGLFDIILTAEKRGGVSPIYLRIKHIVIISCRSRAATLLSLTDTSPKRATLFHQRCESSHVRHRAINAAKTVTSLQFLRSIRPQNRRFRRCQIERCSHNSDVKTTRHRRTTCPLRLSARTRITICLRLDTPILAAPCLTRVTPYSLPREFKTRDRTSTERVPRSLISS